MVLMKFLRILSLLYVFLHNPQVTLLSTYPGLELQVASWDFVAAPDTITFFTILTSMANVLAM